MVSSTRPERQCTCQTAATLSERAELRQLPGDSPTWRAARQQATGQGAGQLQAPPPPEARSSPLPPLHSRRDTSTMRTWGGAGHVRWCRSRPATAPGA